METPPPFIFLSEWRIFGANFPNTKPQQIKIKVSGNLYWKIFHILLTTIQKQADGLGTGRRHSWR